MPFAAEPCRCGALEYPKFPGQHPRVYFQIGGNIATYVEKLKRKQAFVSLDIA
jgi:hypothetical protein